MGLDLTAFDPVFKNLYIGPVRKQLNEKTNLLSFFTKADVTKYAWEGNNMIIPLHKGRNVGIKATTENSLLPAAGKQQYAKLQVPMRYLHGTIELTIQVLKQAKSDRGSFIRALESEQKGMINDMSRQRNRMLAGSGSGILALVNGAIGGGGSTTVQVDTPGGVAGSTNGTRFLKAGMVIAFHDQAAPTTTIDAVRTISTVDSGVQITLTASVANVDDNAPITLAATDGSTNEGSYNSEPVGILGLADSTTYLASIHGIDRSLAANAFFRSQVVSSAGALSTDLLQRTIDNNEEISGEVVDCFLVHSSVRREYQKLLEADRRYSGAILMAPDGGTKAGAFKAELEFNGIPFKVEKDLAYGTIVLVNKSHLFWAPLVEGEWADEDGSVLGRMERKDAYEGRFRLFENFGCDKGAALARIDGVTATVSSGVFSD